MRLPALTDGVILRRYKRFLADLRLVDGALVTAHCPNTGSMATCWEPGAPAQLSRSDSPHRKLAWTLERIDMGRGWVGVNTARVNGVVAEAFGRGGVAGLESYGELRREVGCRLDGHPASRLDFRLDSADCAPVWVEVKNVTLLHGGRLRFPDAVSARALKHLELLAALVAAGDRGLILFALNRPEGSCFSPAEAIDPGYAQTLRRVAGQGVEVLALRLRHTVDGVEAAETVSVDLAG
jgi:sugar fermentation stimulation protein A